ncbi:unnamed protein product [Allacma fusca]|uniref:Transposase n=1 Tax=Allacma fusca TaxID=39272 RepID=A0A8J2JDF4_9HEXA|nr:unnamed protein product [Allacma fusca]
MYNEKLKIMDNIQSAPGKISITVDCWSTRNSKSFQGILASFTSKDWTYEQVVLDMDIIQGSHSGKNPATSILGVLDEFKITSKILGVTCDNASNMNTMATELEEKLSLRRVRCLAHIVNLSCQAALAIIKAAIPKYVEKPTHELEIEYSSEEEMPTSKELSIYWIKNGSCKN